MYKKVILDNGLRIITHPMPKMQSVAVGIWINIGGRYESPEFKGVSHYLEHLLFKGSKKYSCRKIKESIEGVGGALNGFTSEELTCYLVKIPAQYLELALDVLSDMVINPVLPYAEVEREKTVILEEIKMYKDLPQSYVMDLLDGLLWPKQPLGMPIIGTVESVSRMNRESLFGFKQKFYTPANIVVSAAGNFKCDRFIRNVTSIFSGLKKEKVNAFVKVREEQAKPQLKIFDKATEQTHLALGFHGIRRDHSLRHAAALLHIILGANMSSRLFHELREKRGMAYEIGTQVKRFQDTGAFIVHAGVDNHKVPDVIQLILKELGKIRATLVGKDEFRRAKDFYIGQLMLTLEDTLDHMLWIGESIATLDRVYLLKELVGDIKKVSAKQVRELARETFSEEKLNLSIIGPLKNAQEIIHNQLHF